MAESCIGSTISRLEKNSRDEWEHFDDGISPKFSSCMLRTTSMVRVLKSKTGAQYMDRNCCPLIFARYTLDLGCSSSLHATGPLRNR